jgi:hypothetical protein
VSIKETTGLGSSYAFFNLLLKGAFSLHITCIHLSLPFTYMQCSGNENLFLPSEVINWEYKYFVLNWGPKVAKCNKL